jgi:Putative Ig domain
MIAVGLLALTLTITPATSRDLHLSLPTNVASATKGRAYSSGNGTAAGGAVVYISGGTAPYRCSLLSGALPAGMSLSAVTPIYPAGLCILTGTPTAAGEFTFTVRVKDADSNTASQSVRFVVLSSSLPVFSNVTVTSVSATSEKISWTTNVPASSRVCYWMGGGLTLPCTPETETTGVTSHSVPLTGLLPGNSYQYQVASRGVLEGAPQNYLQSADGGGHTFNTASAPGAGTQDFLLSMAGPHGVIQGYPLIVTIYSGAIAGTRYSNGWNLVLGGLPANSQAHWPDQQDYGLGQGRVKTTKTTNDTLTLYGPSYTQFEIITNVGGTTPPASYILTLTATATPTNSSPVTHTYTWAMNVAAVPSFPFGRQTKHPALGHVGTWATAMTTYGRKWCSDPAPPPNEQGVWYYDGINTFFRIADYTSSASPWVACANAIRTQYRDNFVIPKNGRVPGYEVFPHGLYRDCTVNSNATSCTALHELATSANGASLFAGGIPYADATNIREASYMLGAKRLDYDAGGGTTLAQVRQMATYCVGIVDQVVNATTNFEEPFMDGLAAQALIEYYEDPKTGNRADVRVPVAIQALADHLWNSDWFAWSGSNGYFLYNVQNNARGVPNAGCGPGCDMQALNLLIAPLYGWLYQNTGLQQYQLEGDTIWDAGVNDPASGGIGWSGKNFSQQYRWSFDYVTWRRTP